MMNSPIINDFLEFKFTLTAVSVVFISPTDSIPKTSFPQNSNSSCPLLVVLNKSEHEEQKVKRH